MNNHHSSQAFLAEIIIEELYRLGVTDFICSPGARAIPLILALNNSENSKKFNINYINDERAAAFFAQGISKANISSNANKLPVLICTSGTAVANYLPGVIEAYYSDTPLLIITTDRPWELHYGNANQTIDQKNIFKDYTSLNIEFSGVEQDIPMHSVLSNIDQLIRVGQETSQPVHLNICFRKPFYDAGFSPETNLTKENFNIFNEWHLSKDPYTKYSKKIKKFDSTSLKKETTTNNNNIAFIAGPLTSEYDINLINTLSKNNNIPVFADIHSNLRQLKNPNIFSLYNHYLRDLKILPDTIFYFGERIISDNIYKFLNKLRSKVIQISDTPYRKDIIENEFLYFNEIISTEQFLEQYSNTSSSVEFLNSISEMENNTKDKLLYTLAQEENTERSFITTAINNSPTDSSIFLSASLIFRECDAFCHNIPESSIIYGNRGATGIDGIIASALGTVQNSDKALLCIVGDQAALHDLNSLSLINKNDNPVIILIVNNNGGSIFHFMSKPELGNSLINPHGLGFENFAAGFGINYKKVTNKSVLEATIKETYNNKAKIIIEALVDGANSVEQFKTF